MKILADQDIPFIENYFNEVGELTLKAGRNISSEDLRDIDFLIARTITQVDARLLHNTKVKYVATVAAGIDHLDTQWLAANGIQWINAKGFNAPPVADYLASVIAALINKKKLPEKKFKAAIIGVGAVGKLVEKNLNTLNGELLLCDPYRARDENNFKSLSLDEMRGCNLITLHVPLTKEGEYPTYHMINDAFLRRQKSGVVIVNASRGAVIDTQALHAHAATVVTCLDVWEDEPHVDLKLLRQAFIATPHIAGYSVQSKIRGTEMIYREAIARQWIKDNHRATASLPKRVLVFAGDRHTWRDVVLGCFNPRVLTAVMHAKLSSAENVGDEFDRLRKSFTYRHELASTTVKAKGLSEDDIRILAHLGLTVE